MRDLRELTRLAQAATLGDWSSGPNHLAVRVYTNRTLDNGSVERTTIATAEKPHDGAFIAATNPVVVLELIERIRALELALKSIAAAGVVSGAAWCVATAYNAVEPDGEGRVPSSTTDASKTPGMTPNPNPTEKT